MWLKFAHTVIKYRVFFILSLLLITAFMGYKAKNGLEMTYKFAKVVPQDDPDMEYFQQFIKTFGQDDNVLVIGVSDESLYEVENFRLYKKLSDDLDNLIGSKTILSLPNLKKIVPNRKEKKFVQADFFQNELTNQEELDSIMADIRNTQVFQGQVIDSVSGAANIIMEVKPIYYQSKKRLAFIKEINSRVSTFEEKSGIKTHITGLPYVRTVLSKQVAKELNLFLFLAIGVTALVLFLFFRSFNAVVVPLVIIGMAVIWVMGTIVLLGYKITLLTGLIPPIIVVIGIPNCVYLINKYHQEFAKHENKIKALSTIIRKIGMVTLITNFTTAIGFLALTFNDIDILREFGTVAGINIMATFIISIIMIPAVYTYLSSPKTRHLKHLDFKFLNTFLESLNTIVHTKRKWVYVATIFLVIICSVGVWKISALSYMVDDIPEESVVVQDLRYFEKNFKGIMPLEIVIDTKDKKAITKTSTLRNLNEFQTFLAGLPEISEPISVINLIKTSNQAFMGGNKLYYDLPKGQSKLLLRPYLKNSNDNTSISTASLIDTTGQVRLSLKVADIGSKKLNALVNNVIVPKAEEIFKAGNKPMDYHITGSTPLFIKGNKFLIKNLRTSLLIAFVLIAFIMTALFMHYRIVVISFIPNLIPLLITGALMGFFGIPLKPSTALIFTIAFGISVDDSIHFLAKYRQELIQSRFSVAKAVTVSIRETGASMIYTSIILFFGFIIFAGSTFQGTLMLGVLTSSTLMFAMFTNLILLPSLLMTFDTGKRKNTRRLIDGYNDDTDDESQDLLVDVTNSKLNTTTITTPKVPVKSEV
ncbi:MAG: RND family transporter [Cyclobacteriaceae bacterium]